MALKLMNGEPVDKERAHQRDVYFPDKAEELLPTRQY